MTIETKRVSLAWQERLIFRGGEAGGPQTTVDGDNATAPGPMLTLLLAAASCTGADVVVILEKMRATLHEFRIEASGVRREQEPRRYTAHPLRVPHPRRRDRRGQGAPRHRSLDHEILLGAALARAGHRDHERAHAELGFRAAGRVAAPRPCHRAFRSSEHSRAPAFWRPASRWRRRPRHSASSSWASRASPPRPIRRWPSPGPTARSGRRSAPGSRRRSRRA